MSDMTLGQKIRELRLSKQLTQKELAGDFITRNMLSQIENDSATPSMKTMEFLARQLEKPIGYFLDKGHNEMNLSHLIAGLIEENNTEAYEEGVLLLEEEIEHNPIWADNKMVMDLYVNSHMRLAEGLIEKGNVAKAKDVLLKILRYENHLMGMTDIYLYKVYDLLAETCSQLEALDEAKDYYDQGKMLINKLLSGREVQSLYIKMMDGEAETLAQEVAQIDTSDYDPYSLARFQMIAGTSMYRSGQCSEAIEYLEQSLAFYKGQPTSSVTTLIYEQLSKCYSEMDEYKKAYDYLQKAQETRL